MSIVDEYYVEWSGSPRSDSPWSKEAPTEAGYYWLRNYCFARPDDPIETGPRLVQVHNQRVKLSVTGKVERHVSFIIGEWAKAELPK